MSQHPGKGGQDHRVAQDRKAREVFRGSREKPEHKASVASLVRRASRDRRGLLARAASRDHRDRPAREAKPVRPVNCRRSRRSGRGCT
jgi:hypothetical protein